MAHPFQEHRQHKVERSRVAARINGYKRGGTVRAEETSGDESDGEIARDAEHRGNRKSLFKGNSPAVHKAGGHVDGKTKKHRLDHRARGGKVSGKGKTIINVVVGKGDQQQQPPMPVPVPVRAPMGGPPGMPPGGPPGLAGGPPGGGLGLGGPPPMPPPGMPRKRGGKVLHASSPVAPAKVIGSKLARDEAAPGRGPTEKDGPGDKMPQNSLAWTDSAKNKTPVQHTDGKIDGPNIGRGKVVTYNRGGKVKNASHAVMPTKGMAGAPAKVSRASPAAPSPKAVVSRPTKIAKPGAYPISAGGRSGNARLEKAHAGRSGHGVP